MWRFKDFKHALLFLLVICFAVTLQPACNRRAGDVIAHDSIVGTLVYIPPTGPEGFHQGSPAGEACRWKDETVFIHVLTRPLAVMETEVSRKMWSDLKKSQPTIPDDPTLVKYSPEIDCPVQNVSWLEVILFANLLSLNNHLQPAYSIDPAGKVLVDATNYKDGTVYCNFDASGYRLPTEGEWEYFARAGTTTPFFTKEPLWKKNETNECYACPKKPLTHLDPFAWLCFNGKGQTHPVGSKKPNPWNLYNIIGNVREFVWDWQSDYPDGKVTDYTGPESGRFKVIRGASVFCYPRAGRSANRYGGKVQARAWGIGFRLVRTLQNEKQRKRP